MATGTEAGLCSIMKGPVVPDQLSEQGNWGGKEPVQHMVRRYYIYTGVPLRQKDDKVAGKIVR